MTTDEIVVALDRGELVWLLARVGGEISVEQMEEAWARREQRWGRWLLRLLFP